MGQTALWYPWVGAQRGGEQGALRGRTWGWSPPSAQWSPSGSGGSVGRTCLTVRLRGRCPSQDSWSCTLRKQSEAKAGEGARPRIHEGSAGLRRGSRRRTAIPVCSHVRVSQSREILSEPVSFVVIKYFPEIQQFLLFKPK